MWIFFDGGAVSIVAKTGQPGLCIRARLADDIEAFRRYCPETSPTVVGGGTDYPVRSFASHEAVSLAVARIVMGIDYSNYKARVARTQGHARAGIYCEIWAALHRLEAQGGAKGPPPRGKPGREVNRRKRRSGGRQDVDEIRDEE